MKLYIKKDRKDYVIYAAIILGCILLDLLTKFLAVKFLLPLEKSVPIIDGVLHLTYVENTGAAFGMLKEHRWVFLTISTIAIILIGAVLYLGHAPSRLAGISLSMIVAGGLGNMVDRIGLGYVIDFIDFCLIDFAVFNGADSFVCVGAGLMLLAVILMPNEEKVKK